LLHELSQFSLDILQVAGLWKQLLRVKTIGKALCNFLQGDLCSQGGDGWRRQRRALHLIAASECYSEGERKQNRLTN